MDLKDQNVENRHYSSRQINYKKLIFLQVKKYITFINILVIQQNYL